MIPKLIEIAQKMKFKMTFDHIYMLVRLYLKTLTNHTPSDKLRNTIYKILRTKKEIIQK